MALAIGVLLLSLTACLNAPERQIQRTQLVMFKSLSFYMPEKSFEEVFGKADEVVEEEEMAYHDTWRAEDPYFIKRDGISITTKILAGTIIPFERTLPFHKFIFWKRRRFIFL